MEQLSGTAKALKAMDGLVERWKNTLLLHIYSPTACYPISDTKLSIPLILEVLTKRYERSKDKAKIDDLKQSEKNS
ncbi:hypothetical protein [Spartinivicinus poritis]|uniref:Uncharacterized protein n=1 Tax=Spartinivicinus poritis TaxID=2994640 RepID=A0ABT5U383_9GAMM|nr:hypothetical protein [Spartinivicinus sp. A2-2]MDE1460818.1 hypothetical protein [Spartinivicinus sp. A2-2]